MALLLRAALRALVFALLQPASIWSLPLFILFVVGGFLRVGALPVALSLALAVLLGAALTALWLDLG